MWDHWITGSRVHWLSVLQPKNFSRCHTYPLTSVGAPSATTLLQHEIQLLLLLKIVPPFQAPPPVSPHIAYFNGHLVTARTSDSCLMLDYVRVINFLIIILFVRTIEWN